MAAIDFPKGVVSGVQLESVLRQLVKTPGFREFDALPIPYRAVATDLVSGKAMVFHDGDLANVMRASMSVPGAIAPADIDDAIYVDGGLTDNLPVDVARSMGADIVIAVNLGTPLLKREELGLGVRRDRTDDQHPDRAERAHVARVAEVHRHPDRARARRLLGHRFRPPSRHASRSASPPWRRSTARLAPLALPPERYAELRIAQTTTPPRDERPIAEIRFRHLERVNPDAAAPNSTRQLARRSTRQCSIATCGGCSAVATSSTSATAMIEESGRRVLDVDAVEKSWGPNYLRFGLGLASDLQGQNTFNAAVSYRRTWINALGGEWRTDLQIGQTSRFYSELYQPLDDEPVAVRRAASGDRAANRRRVPGVATYRALRRSRSRRSRSMSAAA